MARILILIVLGWILYLIIKRVLANTKKAQESAKNTEKDPVNNTDEKILQCTQCGCHVPESDTKLINEKIICTNPECSKTVNGS